jgi:hypothetical protein
MNFNLQGFPGGNVNYNPPAGATPFLMNQETVQALVAVVSGIHSLSYKRNSEAAGSTDSLTGILYADTVGLRMFTALDFFAGSGLVRLGLAPEFETVWANDNCAKKRET